MKHSLSTLTYAMAALALSACGGGSSGLTAPSGTSADAFVASVQSFIRTAPNDSEPLTVDKIALTAPENTEPTAIP